MSSFREGVSYEASQVDNFPHELSTSGSSCSSCCDYRSDDSIPEWDDSVQDNGELFFVKCSPIISDLSLNDESANKNNESASKANKISTFLRKRRAKKREKKVSVGTPIKNDGRNIHFVSKIDHSNTAGFEDVTKNFATILYLNLENVDNSETNIGNSTVYHFPQTAHENVINSIKGAFLTLFHLLPKVISEEPESSTIFIKDELVHVVYTGEDRELMIVALPDSKCSLFEVKQISRNIRRFLIFKFGSLHQCFSNPDNTAPLNQFFGSLFLKLPNNHSNQSSSSKIFAENDPCSQIEDLFSLPSRLSIPINLETQIHEKLNDIEANDFGDLSEDHYGCQRLFTLIGTCFYYKGLLIATHLSCEDQLDVHIFLRYNDILDLSINSCMESLVMWQEVFLSSSRSIEGSSSSPSKKRWFVLVTGKKQGLLVTLLESGGCSVSSEGSIRPDELYIEQIQEILNDILHFNISDVVEKLTESASMNNHKTTPRKSIENLNVHSGSAKKLHEYGVEFNPTHHSSSIQVNGAEGDSFSESLSRTTSSLFSDETVPVIGRRAQRMKQLNNSGSIYSLSHSTLSDSDRSDYDTTGSSHSSSFSEANKKFSKTSSSKRIIHGDERALFYYLNVQAGRGVIMCSPNGPQMHIHRRYPSILKTFKSSVQRIHNILSKKKPCPVGKFQRNNLSVKEYGILFEYYDTEDVAKRNSPITYWIVGRAFNKGHSGEVYVCYEDKTPQTLVEIAFRLAMSS